MPVRQVIRGGKRLVRVTTGRTHNDRPLVTRMARLLTEQSRQLAVKDAIIGHIERNRRCIAGHTVAEDTDTSAEAEDQSNPSAVVADDYESKLRLLRSMEANVGCHLNVQPMACEMSADRKSLTIDGRCYDIPMADGSYGDGGHVSATERDIRVSDSQLDDELGDCLSDSLEETEHSFRDDLKTAGAAKHVAISDREQVSAEEPKPAVDWMSMMSMMSQGIGSSHRTYTRKYTIGTDLSGDGIHWDIYI